MPNNNVLREQVFGPEEIKLITAAFDDALRELDVADRADPVATVVAKKMIEVAQTGERDPVRLRRQTLQALRP